MPEQNAATIVAQLQLRFVHADMMTKQASIRHAACGFAQCELQEWPKSATLIATRDGRTMPMPLRDHFHGTLKDIRKWTGFHSAWINTMVRHLNTRLLPQHYHSEPNEHLGPNIEVDIATREEKQSTDWLGKDQGNGVATAVWSPPAATQTIDVVFPVQDLFEVRVYDDSGAKLVAVVELVSPSNKDRPENRQAFAIKCASYLQDFVSVVVIDIVTDRQQNLHREVAQLLGVGDKVTMKDSPIYAVAYKTGKMNQRWLLEVWPNVLSVGQNLPVVPLWLASDLGIPLDLESTYEETCSVLRIS
jgi:hypothetical protein